MLLSVMLAASQAVAAPSPGKPIGDYANWFNEGDFAPDLAGAAVRFKVLFKPDGTPERCAIVASSGNSSFETIACKIIHERFRYEPSLNREGQPTHLVLERMVRVDGGSLDSVRGQPPFTVKLPGKAKAAPASIIVDVSASGELQGCAVSDASKKQKIPEAICTALHGVWHPMVETNAAGQPVAYVRYLTVAVEPVAS